MLVLVLLRPPADPLALPNPLVPPADPLVPPADPLIPPADPVVPPADPVVPLADTPAVPLDDLLPDAVNGPLDDLVANPI